MKYIKFFNSINESKNDNLIGFRRKLMEIINIDQIDDVLELIPNNIIMPIFYKGDVAILKEDYEKVKITEVSYKNDEYIYYYISDEYGEVYSYESDFIF